MRVRALVLAMVLGVLVAGCGGSGGDGGGGQSDGGETGGAKAASPFTGEDVAAGPVLAVKVDNAPQARPQVGLGDADIVYAEQVEAGLSRFLAVFSGTLPDEVGPVRSARQSDLELLRQFGTPALAYSGVQSALQPELDDARLIQLTPGMAPEAYERHDDRDAPHNLFGKPKELLAAAPDASDAADIGFRFGDAPASGGADTTEEKVSFPAAEFGFSWSAQDKHWKVSLDGDNTDLAPATVVVQHVTISQSEFHDSSGAFTPFTQTTGEGAATVLRDGKKYEGRWSRPDADSGTTFTTPDGEPLRFATGQVWVVLAEA
ncbi:secreted protein [Streptomyces xiamenensis]|uniref:Secreted protein n=1 Tax=Streptomyces xiamenensis TaxID=408015 RepID=A0A0F7FTU2_9ACTN|nr:DUF3048 domain-containing protein [Streptomyces xiamenensis]AKG43718.1 secreted protein [Streptomyces xiamenensis]